MYFTRHSFQFLKNEGVRTKVLGGYLTPLPLVGEQPCSKSSNFWIPPGTSLQHRIHDGQQLSHAGDDDDFGELPGLLEALSESLDNRIAAHRRDCGHVQHGAQIGPATPDESFPVSLATVVTVKEAPRKANECLTGAGQENGLA